MTKPLIVTVPKKTYNIMWPYTGNFPEGGVIDVDAIIRNAEETGVYDTKYGEAWLLRQLHDRGKLDEFQEKANV